MLKELAVASGLIHPARTRYTGPSRGNGTFRDAGGGSLYLANEGRFVAVAAAGGRRPGGTAELF